MRAPAHAGAEERARLRAVQALERLGGGRPALRLEVHHLAADEPARAARLAEHGGGGEPPPHARLVPAVRHLGQQVEGAA